MWTRLLLIAAILIGGGWVASPPVQAGCLVDSGTYTTGQTLREPLCDTNGNLKVTTSSGGGVSATATAAAPSYAEASNSALSLDLAGNLRTTLGTLLSGEDQSNNLLMVGPSNTRVTQIVGTGGVPSTASDTTWPAVGVATILPNGMKTFQGVITCTGSCVQIQKIYGSFNSAADTTKSDLVCTISLSGTTTDHASCKTNMSFSYWFIVTSGTSGTTPLAITNAYY